MAPKLIVICGPTATGKTKLGVALAQRLGGEVVSADSMQVYRDMAIGTARPTPEEMAGVPHHMMGVVDPRENYSVARYVQEATAWGQLPASVAVEVGDPLFPRLDVDNLPEL